VSPTPIRRPVGRPRRRLPALAVLAASPLLLSACASEELPNLAFPEPATEEGASILFLWESFWVTAFIVGGLTLFLILFAALFYRRRAGREPQQTKYNVPIEVLYTIVPLIIVAVLTIFTWRDEAELTALSGEEDHTVNVVGFRWNWAFNYIDEDAYDIGAPTEFPTLYLPVDEKVRFVLTSPDVIHSFWVPDFLFKMDVIPGRVNEFEVTPNKVGTFSGKCAELCGVDHSRMLFTVKVVSRDEFDRHIAELKAKGQDGLLDTGRPSDEADSGQGRTTIGGDA
jgi:cytochrome c oxidase subunit 2